MRPYRIVFNDGNPHDRLFSRATRGRFHDENTLGKRTSYTAVDPQTAWAEILKYSPDADPTKFVVLLIELLAEVLDLTDLKVQAKEKIDESLLTGPHEPCQELARRLRAQDAAAILTYSAADRPDGRCVAIFEQCLKSKKQFRVRKVQPLAELLGPAPPEPLPPRSPASAKSARHKASRRKS